MIVGEQRRTGRQGLIDRALAHHGFVAVETGGGFAGEQFVSNLIDRFAKQLGSSVGGDQRAAGDLVDPDDIEGNTVLPVALIRAPLVSGLRGWRDTVTARMDLGKPTIVVLPDGASGDALLRETVPPLLVDTARLVLDAADVADLLTEVTSAASDDAAADRLQSTVVALAELIGQHGDGWPAFAGACVEIILERGIDTATELISTIGSTAFRDRIVRRHLNSFSPDDVKAMAQLAYLGTFDAATADAAGGLDFAELVLARAPGVLRTDTGTLRFIRPVRQFLLDHHPLDTAAAESLAPTLVGNGEVATALNALIRAGLHGAAADLVDATDGPTLDAVVQRDLLAALRVLEPQMLTRPGLRLKLARVHQNLGDLATAAETCEAAMNAAGRDSAVWLEAAAERLWHRHRLMDQGEAQGEIAALNDELARRRGGTAQELDRLAAAGTRLREIAAIIRCQSPEPRLASRGVDDLVAAAAEWEHRGEELRAASGLRIAAISPLLHLGRYREAQRLLDRAARLAIGQAFAHGVTLTFKAMIDAVCGDRDAFQVSRRQAKFAIEAAGIDWLQSYLLIATAADTAWDQDVQSIDRCFRACRELLGYRYDTDDGVLMHVDMAMAFAVAGDTARAQATLDQIVDRAEEHQLDFDQARLIVAARSGDHAGARQLLDDIDQAGMLPNDRRWRLVLEIEAVSPSPDEAVIGAALADASRLGLTDLSRRLFPQLFGAESATSTPGTGPAISVLGRFEVRSSSGGTSIKPASKIGQLLGFLAASGGAARVDTVADLLWPGVDLEVARRRLPNVETRCRREFGDLVHRVDGTLRLDPSVKVDLEQFSTLVSSWAAHRAHDASRARSDAIAALDTYRGPVVGDGELFEPIREKATRDAQMLLDDLIEQHAPTTAWVASVKARIEPAV